MVAPELELLRDVDKHMAGKGGGREEIGDVLGKDCSEPASISIDFVDFRMDQDAMTQTMLLVGSRFGPGSQPKDIVRPLRSLYYARNRAVAWRTDLGAVDLSKRWSGGMDDPPSPSITVHASELPTGTTAAGLVLSSFAGLPEDELKCW